MPINKAKRDAKKKSTHERRAHVMHLRKRGATLRTIADQLGVSHVTVHNDIKYMLEELAQQNLADAYVLRELELERLDT